MYFNKNEEIAYNMGYRVDESGNLFDNKNVIKNLNTPKRGYNIFQINNANNKKMKAQCEEMSERLKLRINQNDTLLQVIDELNKKLQEVKK